MSGQLLLAVVIGVMASLVGLVMAYRLFPRFRFWFFDIWADLPFIGTVARRSRMSNPTTERANARLDGLFHAYLLHIPDPISEAKFAQVRRYLFLACDSQSRPTPPGAWLLLLTLICAESYAFSFLLGVSLSNDMSQNRAELVAIGIAFILGLVLLLLAHWSGHQLRRTNELRAAGRHAIDRDMELDPKEKPIRELSRRVSLEDDQAVDEPLLNNFESQRFINRVAKSESDRGGYLIPGLFVIAVLLLAFEQFQLRSIMASIASSAGTASLGGDQAATWANGLFVVIFLMTQGLALMFGYKYGFMGQDSERGFEIIGGRNDYNDYRAERDPMIRRADESLASLYSKLRSRYSQIKPENLSYMQRFHREEDLHARRDLPASPPAEPEVVTTDADNVTPLTPRDGSTSGA